MEQGTSPTLRLWQLAEALRGYREQAKLTIDQAGKVLKPLGAKWSRSKVQRIEARLYAPKPSEVEQLASAYGISKRDTVPLVEMTKEARVKGWWQSSALPNHVHTMVGLERAAKSIRQFSLSMVPGLLQTSDYARGLMTAIQPLTPPEGLEAKIAARLTRQHVLTESNPPELHIILAEPAVRWPVGGNHVMAQQVQRLLDLQGDPNITLQLIPFSAGANPGMEDAFTVLTLPHLASDIGFVEGIMGSLYLESQDHVRTCLMRFATLSELALSPTKSSAFLLTIIEEYQQ